METRDYHGDILSIGDMVVHTDSFMGDNYEVVGFPREGYVLLNSGKEIQADFLISTGETR